MQRVFFLHMHSSFLHDLPCPPHLYMRLRCNSPNRFTCGVLSYKKSDWTRWWARWAVLGRGIWPSWARWAGLGKVVVSVFWFNWFTCTVWGLCWYHFCLGRQKRGQGVKWGTRKGTGKHEGSSNICCCGDSCKKKAKPPNDTFVCFSGPIPTPMFTQCTCFFPFVFLFLPFFFAGGPFISGHAENRAKTKN